MDALPAPSDVLDSLPGYDGAQLLLSDIRMTAKLLNEARYQTTARLFGVSREDSLVVTLVAVGAMTAAGHRTVVRLTKGPPLPDTGTLALASGSAGGIIYGLAGSAASAAPAFVPLVLFGVVASSIRPLVRRSVHEIRLAVHHARHGFNHRYGHLLARHGRTHYSH